MSELWSAKNSVDSATDGSNPIVTVVNLDPHNAHGGWIEFDLDHLGLDREKPYQMHDLLTGAHFLWQGARNFVRLDPARVPAHILRVERIPHP